METAASIFAATAFLRRRDGGIRYRLLKASLNRRRLEKPLRQRRSLSPPAELVSVSSCFASSRRRVRIN